MKIGWIDSHAHLMDDQILINIDDVIQRAKDNNITRIMLIALSTEEMELGLRLKEKYEMLDLAIGFHPSDAHLVNDNNYQIMEEHIKSGKIDAIGEIGLDYYWDKTKIDIQKMVFRKQLNLAVKYNLPVIIHMRESTEDVFEMLNGYKGRIKGVMHCYTGSLEMAKRFINLGFFVSFAGPLTYKNANNILEVAKNLPLDRLLVETDAPYLTPHPFRGKINEPMYVRHTGERLSEILDIDVFTIQSQLTENYHLLFKVLN